MKFMKYLAPDHINQLCEQGKVKVQITVTVDDGEIVRHLPNGESITETYEQIIFQQGSEIRSWNVLFQLDEKHSSF